MIGNEMKDFIKLSGDHKNSTIYPTLTNMWILIIHRKVVSPPGFTVLWIDYTKPCMSNKAVCGLPGC